MSSFSLRKCFSSPDLKGTILLRVVHRYVKKINSGFGASVAYSEFQILDLRTGELSKTLYTLLGDAGVGTIVGVGSVIYVIGKPRYCGSDPPDYSDYKTVEDEKTLPHEGLSYFDLASPPQINCWKKAPLPEQDQYIPNCVLHFGKVYVFRSSNFSCFGEVFDPELNTWDPSLRVSPPPFSGEYEVLPPVISDPLHGRVLINFKLRDCPASSIYAYYPAQATWSCIVQKFIGRWRKRNPMVLVDGVIYFYHRKLKQLVEAYDLTTNQFMNVVLSSEFENCSQYVFDALHHLGDDLLCLLTYSFRTQNVDPAIIKDHTIVHAVPFRAHRTTNCNEVLVTPLSSRSYPFDSCCQVHGYIPL